MKIPYHDLELRLALVEIDAKITEEAMDKIGEFIQDILPQAKVDMNKLVAEANGISVVDLINSVNYEKLKEEYVDDAFDKLVVKIQEIIECDAKAAWAIVYAASGGFG